MVARSSLVAALTLAVLLGAAVAVPSITDESVPAPVPSPIPVPAILISKQQPAASCHLWWLVANTCDVASASLAKAAKGMSGFTNCNGSQKCGYTVYTANSTMLEATHTSPVHHYVDDIVMTFTTVSSGCQIDARSASEQEFITQDNGVNYCNLENLITAADLFYNEIVYTCTQQATADCDVY